MLSYMEYANNKSAIGENNLKLNIVANLILIFANVILFYTDWYVHTDIIQDPLSPYGMLQEFRISIFSITLMPGDTHMSIG